MSRGGGSRTASGAFSPMGVRAFPLEQSLRQLELQERGGVSSRRLPALRPPCLQAATTQPLPAAAFCGLWSSPQMGAPLALGFSWLLSLDPASLASLLAVPLFPRGKTSSKCSTSCSPLRVCLWLPSMAAVAAAAFSCAGGGRGGCSWGLSLPHCWRLSTPPPTPHCRPPRPFPQCPAAFPRGFQRLESGL